MQVFKAAKLFACWENVRDILLSADFFQTKLFQEYTIMLSNSLDPDKA